MINFYETLPETEPIHNPFYGRTHFIKIPARIGIISPSGGGKSNALCNLIHYMKNTFEDITIITGGDPDEPLYKMLVKKLNKMEEGLEPVRVIAGLQNTPPVMDFDPASNHLVVFDDIVNIRKQPQAEEYFKFGRKRGCTCVYISQNYYTTPIFIRRQFNYLFILKMNSNKDCGRIISECSLELTKQQLFGLYKYCTSERMNFLGIRLDVPDDCQEHKYFHNFRPIPPDVFNGILNNS